VALRWSQLTVDTDGGEVSVQVGRSGRSLRLLLASPAAGPLLALREVSAVSGSASPDQYIFSRSARGDHPLTSRAAREIVRRACGRAGFPLATAPDLRAAFGYWLRARGPSDHETATVLGLRQVRSLDRLLGRHRALDAQRRIREALASE
jgi:integrase